MRAVEDVCLHPREGFHPGQRLLKFEKDIVPPPQQQRLGLPASKIIGDPAEPRDMRAIVKDQRAVRFEPTGERHDPPVLLPQPRLLRAGGWRPDRAAGQRVQRSGAGVRLHRGGPNAVCRLRAPRIRKCRRLGQGAAGILRNGN